MQKIESGQVYWKAAAYDAVQALIDHGNVDVAVASTGGGSGVGPLILRVPGASSILWDAAIPYRQKRFDRKVGRPWKQDTGIGYCAPQAAIALAQATHMEIQQDAYESEGKGRREIIAVGVSAAIPTSRELRGGTRLHAAIRTTDRLATVSLDFDQHAFTRDAGDELCDVVALNLILNAVGLPLVPLRAGLPITVTHGLGVGAAQLDCRPVFWDEAMRHHALGAPLFIGLDGKVSLAADVLDPAKFLVMPGSYNPATFGHDFVADHAKKATGKEVVYEITGNNAAKKGVDDDELWRRASLLVGRHPIILSRDLPLYIQKVAAYNNCSFAVGGDTTERILRAKYYQGGQRGLQAALADFDRRGTRFYTMSRVLNGKLFSRETLRRRMGKWHRLFPALDVTCDVSSSEIR